MESDELAAGSLALALGGFSVGDEELADLALPPSGLPGGGAGGGRSLEVAAGTAALVDHARSIVGRVLSSWKSPGFDPQQECDGLSSLCFALRSAVGCAGRLSQGDTAAVFELAAALWGAALQALSAGGSTDPDATCNALEGMADELYALVEADSTDGSGGGCPTYASSAVALFSRQAAGWAAAGQRERARRCLEHAMRHSQALEAEVAGPGPCEHQEGKVVALFTLYLEGAKSAADNRQQALANNLLSRAVALSRHAAVGPDAALCCAVGIAELQLAQAHQMLAGGSAMPGLAVALLSASYQQLTRADLATAAASGSAHAAGLLDAKKQVLALLCRAYLAAGDVHAASKALDTLDSVAPGAAAADAASQALFVEVKVAAGKVPEALRFLVEQLRQADLTADLAAADVAPAAAAFLAGLRLALPLLSADTLPSFQSAASAFVWKATAAGAASPGALLGLVQALLAQEREQALCHQLALQALSGDDVSATLHSSARAMSQVHSVLWHRAAQCFEAGTPAPAKELFAAAFQFAQSQGRSKNARALASCHSRLGMHQRAAEWLDIAARQEQPPSSLTQLARLQELALTGDAPQALAVIRSLASPPAPDFHPSLLPALCQAAARARQPEVYKAAVSAAVQMLIKGDASIARSSLEPGQEAALLLELVQAVVACLNAAPPVAAGGAGGIGSSSSSTGNPALFAELAAAVKLATQRLKLLGWATFVGPAASQGSTSVQALCALAYNQLLAAQQCGAHEHAVALATSLGQLLPLADSHLQEELAGAAGQAKVLLLASQALLDVHRKQPESTKPLALATKLQMRISQLTALLPAEQHMQLLHHCLCLETAARQGDGAAMLHSLSKLQPHSSHLLGPQREAILASVGNQLSGVVREAACTLLLDSVAADGSLEAAAVVPALLSQLALQPEQQLRAVAGCYQLLVAIPAEERSPAWALCCQWLAAHSWNAGVALARSGASNECSSSDSGSGSCAEQLLGEAVRLQEACAGPDSHQLHRMTAALAGLGLGAANSTEHEARQEQEHGQGLDKERGQEEGDEEQEKQQDEQESQCEPMCVAPAPAPALGDGVPDMLPAAASSGSGAVQPAPPERSSPVAEQAAAAAGGGAASGGAAARSVSASPRNPAPSMPAATPAQPSAAPDLMLLSRGQRMEAASSRRVSMAADAAAPQCAADTRGAAGARHDTAVAAPAGAARDATPAARTVLPTAPAAVAGTARVATLAAPRAAPMVLPAAADDDELSMSESDAEEPAGGTWLTAVFAAQKRALGSSSRTVGAGNRPGPAKRRAVTAPGGGVAAVPAAATQLREHMSAAPLAAKQALLPVLQKAAQPVQIDKEDNADALSLGEC